MASRITGLRTVYTFSHLYIGASQSLERAKQEQIGWYFDIISTIVMTAFTLEAYANHLIEGNEVGIEMLAGKRESIWEKYKRLRIFLRLPGNCLEEDYPYAAQALKFRNQMAHGRTVSIAFDEEVGSEKMGHTDEYSLADWEKLVTVEFSQRALHDVESVLSSFHYAAGLGACPLYKMAVGSSVESN